MKNRNYLQKIAMFVLFVACLGTSQIFAQSDKKNLVAQGVFWMDKETGTEIYLFPGGSQGYRLTVISKQDVKVTYHTRINSIEVVDKILAAKETSGGVRFYEFEHHFSKMTIWMALQFEVGGKKIPALARTFYNSIFEPDTDNIFLEADKKKKN